MLMAGSKAVTVEPLIFSLSCSGLRFIWSLLRSQTACFPLLADDKAPFIRLANALTYYLRANNLNSLSTGG